MPRQVISIIVMDKIRDSPGYQPMQIVKDFWRDFDLPLSYKQTWRGKESAKLQIHGAADDSYMRLPWFCQRIMEFNPGSLVELTTKGEVRFNQLFVAFHASLHGFRTGCHPILFIDGTFLKGSYKGILLSAIATDAGNIIFLVAFAVVSSESYEDWKWFLINLKRALNFDGNIIFVSDRNKNILRSVVEVFDTTIHAHCYRHLEQNFLSSLKGLYLQAVAKKALNDAFCKVAYARLDADYEEALQDIRDVSSEATISWRSVKQTMVATSSNHAETLALHEAEQECFWFGSMINHINDSCGIKSIINKPAVLYEDNMACIAQMKT